MLFSKHNKTMDLLCLDSFSLIMNEDKMPKKRD